VINEAGFNNTFCYFRPRYDKEVGRNIIILLWMGHRPLAYWKYYPSQAPPLPRAPRRLRSALTEQTVWFACVVISGLIDEVNKKRRMYYKHQFLLLTIEFHYRFAVPSPLSIVVQIFALIKKDFRRNPFGTCWSGPRPWLLILRGLHQAACCAKMHQFVCQFIVKYRLSPSLLTLALPPRELRML